MELAEAFGEFCAGGGAGVTTPPAELEALRHELAEALAELAATAAAKAQLSDDLQESLARQRATADLFKIVSQSVADVAPVFDAILDSCLSLFSPYGAAIYLVEGEMVRGVARRGFADGDWGTDARPLAGSSTARVIADQTALHIEDLGDDPKLPEDKRAAVRSYGGLSVLYVPMRTQNRGIGSLVVARRPKKPFGEAEIAFLDAFADQAVIAIENARLFNEAREALAQQTATSNALKVISRSALGLHEVMQTLIDSAVRLCADDGVVYLRAGDVFLAEAAFDANGEKIRARNRTPRAPGRSSMTGRVAISGEIEFIPDTLADGEFEVAPDLRLKGIRSLVGVPLLRENQVEGVFILGRREPGRFGARAVELAKTFADQAVIVIENVRLLEEVRARTRDVEQALTQQTTTSEILRVISQSPTDARPVFESIVVAAARLLRCDTAFVQLVEGRNWRNVAVATPQGLGDVTLTETFPIDPELNFPSRAIVAKETVYLSDWSVLDMPAHQRRVQDLYGFQASLHLPLLREQECVGVLTLLSRRAHAFGEVEITQSRSFRNQALIAIENARLFHETQESLAQQTATADVLKVISRSVFDLDAVLQTLIDTAVRLARGSRGTIFIRDGDVLRARAFHSQVPPSLKDYLIANPTPLDSDEPMALVARGGRLIHVPDMSVYDTERVRETRKRVGFGAGLWVPLMRDGESIGLFGVPREEAIAFTDREIELVRTFADQAVIAIENARLFEEVRSRTRELEQSLDNLRKTQDRLVQSEKLASLGQLTAGIAHEIKNPLNFVNNFATLSRELLEELRETLDRLPEDARADSDDLIGMIDKNLEKVASHGKRADSIVKNMLLHSRDGSGERTRVNVNSMVEEALNLGYHGAKAEKPGFNVTLEKALEPDAGEADLYLQEVTRVLLNLISNGFYATDKRRQAEGPDYAPTLRASTRDLGPHVEIRIRDNGAGIPDEVRAKMFNPFFTTKPAGEGTGLGLSLSHDIVVKQHGGTLEVETSPGAFTEFIITLPREGAKT